MSQSVRNSAARQYSVGSNMFADKNYAGQRNSNSSYGSYPQVFYLYLLIIVKSDFRRSKPLIR